MLRDALNAMAVAYDRANEPDKALIVLRELIVHTRKVQQNSLRERQRKHLERLALGHPPRLAPETLLERRASALRARAAEIEMKRARIEFIERLAVVAELREDPSGEHCYRVGRLSALLAEAAGYDDGFCVSLELAARLHDLGKLAIPDGVLLKPDRLNEREWDMVRRHARVGSEIVTALEGEEARLAQNIMLCHHQWWNGTGYPEEYSRQSIPIEARIVALADSFDAMTHDRPYRPAYPVDIALHEIGYLSGKQFDPVLVDHFIRLIKRLRQENTNLDELLARPAGASPFVRARQRLAQFLSEVGS
jgi:putative two-component system response regulator